MIGSTLFRAMSSHCQLDVFGTIRNASTAVNFDADLQKNLILCDESEMFSVYESALKRLRPDVVINCIGVTKHLEESSDPLLTIPVNSLLPHYLCKWAGDLGSRFIQISTDCVFSGLRGEYLEEDVPDASDLYGRSKILGEISDQDHALTLRTSTIGPEFHTSRGLLMWFLKQESACIGYKSAYFSGLPTVVLADVISNIILTKESLNGIYHLSAERISKYELLNLIKSRFRKEIDIIPQSTFRIDRSLSYSKLSRETGYTPMPWEEMIDRLFVDFNNNFHV
jgi:dTDP-4-dehydrorhamnose reductase